MAVIMIKKDSLLTTNKNDFLLGSGMFAELQHLFYNSPFSYLLMKYCSVVYLNFTLIVLARGVITLRSFNYKPWNT